MIFFDSVNFALVNDVWLAVLHSCSCCGNSVGEHVISNETFQKNVYTGPISLVGLVRLVFVINHSVNQNQGHRDLYKK